MNLKFWKREKRLKKSVGLEIIRQNRVLRLFIEDLGYCGKCLQLKAECICE